MGVELSKQSNSILNNQRCKADVVLRDAFKRKFTGDYTPMSLEALAGIRLVRHYHDGPVIQDLFQTGQLPLHLAWILYFYYLMHWSHANKFIWRQVLGEPCLAAEVSDIHRRVHVRMEREIASNMAQRDGSTSPRLQVMHDLRVKDYKENLRRNCSDRTREMAEQPPFWIWVVAEACKYTRVEQVAFWRQKERYSKPDQRRRRAFMARAPMV